MSVTVRDVAKYSGLSVATVSRVINNSPDVAETTRKKVNIAIDELGYAPPVIARGITMRKMKTVGLLIPDINNMYYPAVIRGIEDTLTQHNYSVFLCNTDEDIDEEKRYINILKTNGINGMMFLGTRHAAKKNDHIVELSRELPVLMINDYIIGSDVYSVMIDEVEGAYRAVKYLIELGHRKIAFINGDVDYTTYRYKRRGYEKALADSEITLPADYVVREDPHEKGGYRGATRLIEIEDRPTAFFTASDQIAIGVMKSIYEHSFAIPGDFSLVGFNDIPIAEQLYPELTTVNQFPHKTGVIAAEVIIKLINNIPMEQKRILLEPKLSIRKSCRSMEEE